MFSYLALLVVALCTFQQYAVKANGGLKVDSVDVKKNKEARAALLFAEQKINDESGDDFVMTTDRIDLAERQRLSGTHYRCKLHLAKSTCTKDLFKTDPNFPLKLCDPMKSFATFRFEAETGLKAFFSLDDKPKLRKTVVSGEGLTCTVVVEQNGVSLSINSKQCEKDEGLVLPDVLLNTQVHPADIIKDKEANDALRIAEAEINEKSTSQHQLKVYAADRAEKTFQSGWHYRFKVRLVETSCKKDQKSEVFDFNQCKPTKSILSEGPSCLVVVEILHGMFGPVPSAVKAMQCDGVPGI